MLSARASQSVRPRECSAVHDKGLSGVRVTPHPGVSGILGHGVHVHCSATELPSVLQHHDQDANFQTFNFGIVATPALLFALALGGVSCSAFGMSVFVCLKGHRKGVKSFELQGPCHFPKTLGSRYWPVDMNVITWLGIYYVKQEMPGAHALELATRSLLNASFRVHGFGLRVLQKSGISVIRLLPGARRLFGSVPVRCEMYGLHS